MIIMNGFCCTANQTRETSCANASINSSNGIKLHWETTATKKKYSNASASWLWWMSVKRNHSEKLNKARAKEKRTSTHQHWLKTNSVEPIWDERIAFYTTLIRQIYPRIFCVGAYKKKFRSTYSILYHEHHTQFYNHFDVIFMFDFKCTRFALFLQSFFTNLSANKMEMWTNTNTNLHTHTRDQNRKHLAKATRIDIIQP